MNRLSTSTAISSNRISGLTLSILLLGILALAGCSSSESDPPPTPSPQPPTPIPTATAVPTVTPEPTATVVSFLPDLVVNDVLCVEFHSGVPVPVGPPRWYQVSGSLLNNGDTALQLQGSIEIRDAEDRTLITDLDLTPLIDPGQGVVFDERVDLTIPNNDFRCRVRFIRPADETFEHITITTIESVFLP